MGNLANKIRSWDNRSANWLSKYFYIPFLGLILGVFLVFFVIVLQLIKLNFEIHDSQQTEKLLFTLNVNTAILAFLTFFNSFWMFYVFNHLVKVRGILKNMDYNLSRRRHDQKHQDENPHR